VLLGKTLKRVFLGTLTRDEIEDLVQNSKYAITETMLALTIFREELNLKLLMLFTGLLFMKIFHWLGAMRVESIARSQGISTWQHIRLMALLGFLAIVDWSFVIVIGIALMRSQTASVLLLFGFEVSADTIAHSSRLHRLLLTDIRLLTPTTSGCDNEVLGI
jgi:E3 ubiquitin-protein ligase synoviolin